MQVLDPSGVVLGTLLAVTFPFTCSGNLLVAVMFSDSDISSYFGPEAGAASGGE